MAFKQILSRFEIVCAGLRGFEQVGWRLSRV